jgi:hypothetical protein
LPELESSLSQAWEQANGNKKAPLEISPIAINALNGITQFSDMLKNLSGTGLGVIQKSTDEQRKSPRQFSDKVMDSNSSSSTKVA